MNFLKKMFTSKKPKDTELYIYRTIFTATDQNGMIREYLRFDRKMQSKEKQAIRRRLKKSNLYCKVQQRGYYAPYNRG